MSMKIKKEDIHLAVMITKLLDHLSSMADDPYLQGHPEWVEIIKEAEAIDTYLKA